MKKKAIPPFTTVEKIEEAGEEAINELIAATAAHGPMSSDHDGYAVILEELDELWEEVRKKPSKRSKKNMRKEAMQVAAMALRFMVDRT